MQKLTSPKKVTFSLPEALLSEVRSAVKAGQFRSQNALVRQAIETELKRIEADRLRQEFLDAAQDPMFMKDIEESEQAFNSADSEKARMLPDD